MIKGDIGDAPYNWTTGGTAGRLLAEFRDNARFVGFKCPECGRVYLPARDVCGECYRELDREPIEVGPEGEVLSYTVVREGNPEAPADTPYALGIVRVDGADTGLVALLLAEEEEIEVGMRVKPVWRRKRAGLFSDLEGFAPA